MNEEVNRPSLLSASTQFVFARAYFAILSYIVIVILARVMGREVFGQYVLVMAVLAWVEVLTTGLTFLLTNRAARGLWGEVRGIYKRLHIVTGCAALVMLALAVPLSRLFGNRSLALLFFAAALDIVPFTLFIANLALLHGLERYRQQVMANMVYPTGKLLLMGGGVLLFRHPAAAFIGMALSSMISLFVSTALLRTRATRETMALLRSAKAEPPSEVRTTLLVAGSHALFFSLDIWVLQWLGVGTAVIGEYGAAQSIVKVLNMAVCSFIGTVIPSIARMGRLWKALSEDREVRRVVQLVVAMLLFGVAFLILTAPWLIRVMFGDKFLYAGGFLRWLAAGYGLLVPGLLALNMLYHTRRGMIAALIAIVGVVVYPVLAWAITSRVGPGGAGAALGVVGLFFLVAAPLLSRTAPQAQAPMQ